jgi:methionyl-tRNA formyltransferase
MFKIIYFSTPEIGLPVLEYLHSNHQILAVVTQPDKPRERGGKLTMTPVKKRALELGIEVLEPISAKEPQFIDHLRSLNPELFVVFAYGHILKKELLDVPTIAPINIHTSLLPLYRGAAPIERSIIHGDTVTGISIMKMDVGMDTGPIFLKKLIEIPAEMDAIELKEKMATTAVTALDEFLCSLANGSSSYEEQEHAKATIAPKILKEELELRIDTSDKMVNQIRGLTSYGGVKTKLFDFDFVKVFKAKAVKKILRKPYEIENNHCYLQSTDGSIEIFELQLPGKKRMSVDQFLNGYKDKIKISTD